MTNSAPIPETAERFAARLLAGDFLLWSPNIQAEAFLNWPLIWATRRIAKGAARPLPFARTNHELTFMSGDAERTIADLMQLEFLSGLLVIKDGVIHIERYAMGLNPDRLWQSSSMVKSIASVLVGAAVADGAIASLDQPVVSYLPELKRSSYDGVTVRHLLTMTSGVEWSEETGDPQSDVTENYIKLIAARRPNAVIDVLKRRPSASRPGTQYYYNSADTFLLGPILTRATALNVAAYCSEKLWVPLGCEQDGFFMLDSDDGMEVLGSCSGATLRDYGRIGLLMLADGIASGKRIVPEGWVEQSTRPVAPGFAYDFEGKRPYGAAGPRSRFEGYGCLWWAYKNGDFQALGAFGQWIYVSPAEKLVVVMLGAVPRTAYMTAEQFRLHRETGHSGSRMRLDFIVAAASALTTKTTSSNNAAPLV
jgi:CubicO group peptidase (beta-lactamase class C family)